MFEDYTIYIPPTIILLMWWYDHLLLLKIQTYIKKQSFNCVWNLMKMYTQIKEKQNDMIKEGYHIDYVYLYFKNNDTIRKYDITSTFRHHILQSAFIDGGMPLNRFIDICRESCSNLEVNENCVMEVIYTFDFKKYNIYYDSEFNQNVKFPLYTETELRSKIQTSSILSATLLNNKNEIEGIDVTDTINSAAGPLGNFYEDNKWKVKLDWVLGKKRQSKYLKLLDSNVEEFVYDITDDFF